MQRSASNGSSPPRRAGSASRTRHPLFSIATILCCVALLSLLSATPTRASETTTSARSGATSSCGPQPPAADEPSGTPPLAPKVLPGWTRVYCTDFLGTKLPPGWDTFRGRPKGDPAGTWAPSHVKVADGMLDLTTARDKSYGDAWVSGGACLCGAARLYGAFFVRSRLTHGGPASIQLLWPKDNRWPPEVDFYESWQYPDTNTFTDHFGRVDHKIQGWLKVNQTKWHTWGVFWTPTRLVFVVDWGVGDWGVWGTLRTKGEMPSIPMTLDLQQQSWCGVAPACPTQTSSMLVDWVTVFAPTSASSAIPRL
jgi:Glycosyl hydrolases family 16